MWQYAALMYSFPYLEPVCCSCPVLIVASWPAYRFLKRQVRWSGSPISLRIFQFVVIHTGAVDVFLEFSCLFYEPMDVGNFIPSSFAFTKSSMYIWKFLVHVLPILKDFQHYLASLWNEHNCAVVWAFFGIALIYNWNENWPFPVLWPMLSFPNLLTY